MKGLLVVPRSRLKPKIACSFEVVAPKLWNSLQLELQSVHTFKKVTSDDGSEERMAHFSKNSELSY